MTIPQPPSPLVDTTWLEAHLDDRDLLVIDASADLSPNTPGGYVSLRDQYLAGHLPGAVFADVVDALSEPDAALWADKDSVLAVVRGHDHDTLLNAISRKPAGIPTEFATPFTHQIPGSTAVPYPDLIDDETGTLLPEDDLRGALEDVPDSERTIAYCGSAIGAATAALALVSLGRNDVAIYDGSLAEWLADPNAPLEAKDMAAPLGSSDA